MAEIFQLTGTELIKQINTACWYRPGYQFSMLMDVKSRQTRSRVYHFKWLLHPNVPQAHVTVDAETKNVYHKLHQWSFINGKYNLTR